MYRYHTIKSFRIFLLIPAVFVVLMLGLIQREAKAGEECKVLLQNKCASCHFVKHICPKIEKNSGLVYWKWTIHSMVKEGLVVSDQEQDQLVGCLVNPDEKVRTLCPVK